MLARRVDFLTFSGTGETSTSERLLEAASVVVLARRGRRILRFLATLSANVSVGFPAVGVLLPLLLEVVVLRF